MFNRRGWAIDTVSVSKCVTFLDEHKERGSQLEYYQNTVI